LRTAARRGAALNGRPHHPGDRCSNTGDAGGLVFVGLMDGTVAAFDDTTLDQLWKINLGSGFAAPPMTFEVNGRQYVAIASGPSTPTKARATNTPPMRHPFWWRNRTDGFKSANGVGQGANAAGKCSLLAPSGSNRSQPKHNRSHGPPFLNFGY
jgi:outer membrane protein assembly factor BamB